MNFRDIWLGMSRTERQALADKAGSTYAYLQKIAGGFGMPSVDLAQRLKAALPKMRLPQRRMVSREGFAEARVNAGKRIKSVHAQP